MTVLDIDALYRVHGPAVRTFIARRVRDEELASDLAQDVWVRVLLHREAYRDTGAPIEAWFFKIARNLVTDHLRHVGLPQSPQRLGDWTLVLPAPRDEMARVDDRLLLTDALATLTPHQRDVVALRILAGCSIRQTHEATGRTEDGIKKLQARALVNLRRMVEAA